MTGRRPRMQGRRRACRAGRPTLRAPLKGITGFRLEALADGSFADNGPGRASNGNFVLNELTVDASPVASIPTLDTWAMALTALLLAGVGIRGLRPRRF